MDFNKLTLALEEVESALKGDTVLKSTEVEVPAVVFKERTVNELRRLPAFLAYLKESGQYNDAPLQHWIDSLTVLIAQYPSDQLSLEEQEVAKEAPFSLFHLNQVCQRCGDTWGMHRGTLCADSAGLFKTDAEQGTS